MYLTERPPRCINNIATLRRIKKSLEIKHIRQHYTYQKTVLQEYIYIFFLQDSIMFRENTIYAVDAEDGMYGFIKLMLYLPVPVIG